MADSESTAAARQAPRAAFVLRRLVTPLSAAAICLVAVACDGENSETVEDPDPSPDTDDTAPPDLTVLQGAWHLPVGSMLPQGFGGARGGDCGTGLGRATDEVSQVWEDTLEPVDCETRQTRGGECRVQLHVDDQQLSVQARVHVVDCRGREGFIRIERPPVPWTFLDAEEDTYSIEVMVRRWDWRELEEGLRVVTVPMSDLSFTVTRAGTFEP